MLQIRLLIVFLLTAAFLPGKLAAQYSGDSGEYVIITAQYGTERSHVDVTNRLKEVARQDRSFRMGNSTFGVDPDHGSMKALHIYARGPDGQERMFEYREGSTVDGAQFRSWSNGEWGNERWSGNWQGGGNAGGGDGYRNDSRNDNRDGYRNDNRNENRNDYREGNRYQQQDSGEYVILSAQYGTRRRHVDVTNRLKEVARQDRSFRMGNSTFGVDPDHGRMKTLHIYARGPDGRERVFEYREGSTVDGDQFRSWSSGEWGNGRRNGRWRDHDRDGNDR